MSPLLLLLVPGHIYFVSTTGDDAKDGLSESSAWRTLERVNGAKLGYGDQVVLEKGATFEGSLLLTQGGGEKGRVVIRSDRQDPATIVAKKGPGITVRTGQVEISDLILKGGATGEAKEHDGILLSAPAGKRSSSVDIRRVDVSGFGGSGISMVGEKGSKEGFDNVWITEANVHGNYGTGIITADGIAAEGKGYAHRNLRIFDCDASDNLGGNGIILSGVEGAKVEYCRAANNRRDGQGLGMWAWCAKDVTFQNCIASGTRAPGDGGGFDLDGGTVDCVVERCLSFDNDGVGYMHCDYPSAPLTHGNVIRDSISIGDGRRKPGEAAAFGFVVWGSGLYDCRIERNIAVANVDGTAKTDFGMLFLSFIRDDKVELKTQKLDNALFEDNLVSLTGKGVPLVSDNFPEGTTREATFRGNVFQTTDPPVLMGPRGVRYDSYDAWAKATGNQSGPIAERWSVPSMDEVKGLKPRDLSGFFQRLGK